eukprot:512640_1
MTFVSLLYFVYTIQITRSWNTMIIFGNATRVSGGNMSFWTISLNQVETTLQKLIQNDSISSGSDIAGGTGTTTYEGTRGEIINYGSIVNLASTECWWASPITFYIQNIEDNTTQNPFYMNNISIRFPMIGYGAADINIKPTELNVNKNDVDNEYDEVRKYINKTLYEADVGIAFIVITGSFHTATLGSTTTETGRTYLKLNNTDLQIVGLFANSRYPDVHSRLIGGLLLSGSSLINNAITNKSQAGYIGPTYFNEIHVKYWTIDRDNVYIIDYNT